MLREFQEEIKRLKQQLEEGGGAIMEGPNGQKVQVVEEIEEVEEVEEVTDSEDEDEDGEDDDNGEGPRDGKVKKKKKRVSKRRAKADRPHGGISEERLAEMAEEVQIEKQKILASKDLEESEKNRLIEEAEARANELESEKRAREEITDKLANIQQKLLVGGVSLLDKEAQMQLEMAKKAADLEERVRKERELQRELEEHEEANLQIEEEYASLQEAKDAKTRKIKKIWALLMSHRSEIKDLQEEHQREREDLLDTIRDLTRELKLRVLVINQFIPPDALGMLEDNAEYDEAAEKWRIHHIAHAGNNIRGKRSLISGQILGGGTTGLHREHEYHSGPGAGMGSHDNNEINIWNPLAAFPDIYLTYDIPINELKKKKSTAPEVKKHARSAKKSATSRRARPDSAGGNRNRTAAKAAPGGGTESSVDWNGNEPEADNQNAAAPSARGLVSKGKRYA
jgi:hypothetical protein